MMLILGNLLLLIALICAVLNMSSYLFKFKPIPVLNFNLLVAVISLSFIVLLHAFIVSDFSFYLVFKNSYSAKPLIYKISGLWGNHEGSFLLLILFLAIFAKVLLYKSKASSFVKEFEFSVSSFLFFLILYLFVASNPFAPNPVLAQEGLGLNPVLQDIALAMHPPLLYIGYVFAILTFLLVLALLLRKEEIKRDEFIFMAKITYISEFFLSIGIALGSWWAYRELGWGGFWFWDPVENISLMPWLLGLILVHLFLLVIYKNQAQKLTVITILLSGSFCLLGFFLVRSGVLLSVHSFASDPTRGVLLLIIFAITAISAYALYHKNQDILTVEPNKISKNANLIYLNSYLVLTIFAIIFLAILYPIIMQFFGQEILLGPSYFNKSLLPIIFIMLILLFMVNNMHNLKLSKVILCLVTILTLIFTLAISLIWQINTVKSILLVALAVVSTLLIFNLLREYCFKKENKKKNLAMLIGHTGFALFFIAISLFSLAKKEQNFVLEIGQKIAFAQYEVLLNNLNFLNRDNYYVAEAEFLVLDRKQNQYVLNAEKRFYHASKQDTSEAEILRKNFNDFSVVFGKILDNNKVKIRLYHNPFMNLIWLSFILVAISFLANFFNREKFKF